MLKRTLTEEEFNGLHESTQEGYTATATDDGVIYNLQVEGMVSDDDVEGLKAALDRERTNVSKAKAKQKELEDRSAAAEERLVTLQAEKDGEITSLTAQLSRQENQEAGRRQKLLLKMGAVLRDKAAIDAIAAHDGNLALLLPKLQKDLEYRIDDDNSIRILATDDEGNRITANEFVAGLRKQKAYWGAFKGSGSSGGGSPPGGGGTGLPRATKLRRGAMTHRQKVDYIKEHGNDAFLSLPS